MQKSLLALILVFPFLAQAAETKFTIGENLNLEGQYFPQASSPQVKQRFGVVDEEFSAAFKDDSHFLLKLRPTAHWDPNNPSVAEQFWYDVPEGYAQLRGQIGEDLSGTLQVGWDTFTWGVTDGYNPVDVVSARRYNDPLNSVKLGAFSILGRLDLGFLLFEGIYIPWQRSSQLPGEKSRWLPRELGGAFSQNGTIIDPPSVPQYYYLVPKTYDDALNNNWGGRLSGHFLGIDLAAYYFDGAAAVPAAGVAATGKVTNFDPNTNRILEVAANPTIGLRPLYYRVKVKGASVAAPLGPLLVRGEAAITDGYQRNISYFLQHDTEFVGEVEHTFYGDSSSFTLLGLVTWANRKYGGDDPNSISTNIPSLIGLFDNAAGLGLRWQPIEAISLEGYAIEDLLYGGSLYKGLLTYRLDGHWKIYAGEDYFEGKITQPIGVYRNNSRVTAGLHLSM